MDLMEATFNLKDVIYITGGVVTGVAFYWRVVVKGNEMQNKIENIEKECDAITKVIEKNESTMFKKFSNIHSRFDKNEEQHKKEHDSLNKEISEIKIGIASMDGKLETIIQSLNK
jgi:hypothetical protein